MSPKTPLLRVENLRLSYRTEHGILQAVDGVNLEVQRGEALIVLGESGCGKSSLARALLRLTPRNLHEHTGGVELDGEHLLAMGGERFRREIQWSRISLVMQAAMNALNPVVRVGEQVAEPLRIHRGTGKRRALSRAGEMLERVGVPGDFLSRYPFELSGGMRQRAVLAMALITEPDLILLDEPTSALDVLTQTSIMNVLKQIKWETGTSMILITHDVATSSEIADHVALMYGGQIAERCSAERFFSEPAHPYSRMLMNSVPRLHQPHPPAHIPGQPPNLLDPPAGCRFADRCPSRFGPCGTDPGIQSLDERHEVRCWLHAPRTAVNAAGGGR